MDTTKGDPPRNSCQGGKLIAVRFWLNFRIPTVAFSGVDVSPAQCARCTWVFGRSGVGRGGRVNLYMIVHFRHFGPGSPIHSRGNYMDTTKGDPPHHIYIMLVWCSWAFERAALCCVLKFSAEFYTRNCDFCCTIRTQFVYVYIQRAIR